MGAIAEKMPNRLGAVVHHFDIADALLPQQVG